MARSDWWYPNISREIEADLEKIVKKDGKKLGIRDKGQLARTVLSEFVVQYENKKDYHAARDSLSDAVQRRAGWHDKHLV
jgi:uncharacterized protein Veg